MYLFQVVATTASKIFLTLSSFDLFHSMTAAAVVISTQGLKKKKGQQISQNQADESIHQKIPPSHVLVYWMGLFRVQFFVRTSVDGRGVVGEVDPAGGKARPSVQRNGTFFGSGFFHKRQAADTREHGRGRSTA